MAVFLALSPYRSAIFFFNATLFPNLFSISKYAQKVFVTLTGPSSGIRYLQLPQNKRQNFEDEQKLQKDKLANGSSINSFIYPSYFHPALRPFLLPSHSPSLSHHFCTVMMLCFHDIWGIYEDHLLSNHSSTAKDAHKSCTLFEPLPQLLVTYSNLSWCFNMFSYVKKHNLGENRTRTPLVPKKPTLL